MIKAAGSEMNLLVTSLPQTLEGLVDGISTLFAGIASTPALASFYPNLVTALSAGPEALRTLALEQIFTAGPLGGMSVTDLATVGVPSSFLGLQRNLVCRYLRFKSILQPRMPFTMASSPIPPV
jgi:hypothetical protein